MNGEQLCYMHGFVHRSLFTDNCLKIRLFKQGFK